MNKVIVVVVLAILVGGALYYFYGGPLPNIGSQGTSNSSSPLTIKSAQLGNNSQLTVDLQNNGQISTKTIRVTQTCAPDYSECQSLGLQPTTFVLPAGNEFAESLTIPQCSFAPNLGCGAFSSGLPIQGQTYYFELQVVLANGKTVNLPVAAVASGSFALSSAFSSQMYPDQIVVSGVSSSFGLFENLSGRLEIALTVDRSSTLTVAIECGVNVSISADLLNKTSYTEGIPVRNTLISTSQPLGFLCTMSDNQHVVLTKSFSTVTTGITKGQYYLVGLGITDYGTFFFWVLSGSTTASSTTSVTTSTFSCSSLLSNLNVTVSDYIASQGKVDLIIKNSNPYPVAFWGIDPEPYYGTTISVNQTIPATTSQAVDLSNSAFEVSVHGIANDFNFYFIPSGANEQTLANQGNLCAVLIKLVS